MIINFDDQEVEILRKYQKLHILQNENEYFSLREVTGILLKQLELEIDIEMKRHSLAEFSKVEELQQKMILFEMRNV